MYFETPTDEAVHRFAAWNAALNTVQQRSLGGESLNCVACLTADVCMVGERGGTVLAAIQRGKSQLVYCFLQSIITLDGVLWC